MNKQEMINEYMKSISEEPKEVLLERFEAFLHAMEFNDLKTMYEEKFS